jgi:predicted DNA-binding protein
MSKPNTNLNIRISEKEKSILLEYCEQTSRQQSEVIREFIRSLEKKIQKLEASNLSFLYAIPTRTTESRVGNSAKKS